MIKQIIILIALGVTFSGCAKQSSDEKEPDPIDLDSLEQKVSYVIGYDTARQMRAEGFVLNAEVMRAAVNDLNNGVAPSLSEEEMNAAMTAFQTQIQEKRQESFNLLADKNRERSQSYLSENAKRDGVIVLASGLQYKILNDGEGVSPSMDDEVVVNFKGKFITGEIFDSGEQVQFRVDQAIPGWVEALSLMKPSAKWDLFVPPDLAYGAGGTGEIEPNSALIFEIELIEIVGSE